MLSSRETNKLKSSSHQQEYSTDNAVKRNRKLPENCMHHTLSNQQNMLLHTMERKQNHSLVRYRTASSFFFNGSNVFVMVIPIMLLQSGPGTHLWILGMMCIVIL